MAWASAAVPRAVNQTGAAELARHDLPADAATETAMVVGGLRPARRGTEALRRRRG